MADSRCFVAAWLLVLLGLNLDGCGGSGGSSGGGGSSPPQPSEVLYVKDAASPVGPQIWAFGIDASSGNLTTIQTISPPASNNSFSVTLLATTPSGKFLYTDDDHWDANTSTLTPGYDAYSIAAAGSLMLVNGSPFTLPLIANATVTDASAVAINPASTALYALGSNFYSAAEFQIGPSSGALTLAPNGVSTLQGGVGLGAVIDPSGKFLYETGSDASGVYPGVLGFSIDPASGNLAPLMNSPYLLPASDIEARDIVMDSTGSFLYIDLPDAESPYQVAGFTRNQSTGDLTAIPGSPFLSGSNAFPQVWALAMHPSGQYLYAYNLNGGSVSAFKIDSGTGALSQVSGSPFSSNGDGSGMAIDPQGKFLYLISGSGQLAIHLINQSTGALSVAKEFPWPGAGGPGALAVVQLQ